MKHATAFAPHQKLAQKLLGKTAVTNDGSHDISHILRVWTNVQTIAATDGGDLRILTAATLLHDAVAVEKDAPNRSQASHLAADAARSTLRKLDWTKDDIDAVAHAIHAHSFSANVTPTTLEAKILQDADRLDAIGLIGVARCFYVSGRMGRAIYDPDDPKAEHRNLNDTKFALDHFQTKLLQLKDSFQTATGRSLAAKRHKQTQSFLTDLLAEIGGPSAN